MFYTIFLKRFEIIHKTTITDTDIGIIIFSETAKPLQCMFHVTTKLSKTIDLSNKSGIFAKAQYIP